VFFFGLKETMLASSFGRLPSSALPFILSPSTGIPLFACRPAAPLAGAAGFDRWRKATGALDFFIHKKAPAFTEAFRGPGGSRTPNLLIRSQMLYPIKLQNRFEGANIG
jgi:hypothetical protein